MIRTFICLFALVTICCFSNSAEHPQRQGDLGEISRKIIECILKDQSAYTGIQDNEPNLEKLCKIRPSDILKQFSGSNTLIFLPLKTMGKAFEALGLKIGFSAGIDVYGSSTKSIQYTSGKREAILKALENCGSDVKQLGINVISCISKKFSSFRTTNAVYDVHTILNDCCLNITHIGEKIESCKPQDKKPCNGEHCLSRHFASLCINIGNAFSQLALDINEAFITALMEEIAASNIDKDNFDKDDLDEEDVDEIEQDSVQGQKSYKQVLRECKINPQRVGNKMIGCTMDENSLYQNLYTDDQGSTFSNVNRLIKSCGVNPKYLASKLINCTTLMDNKEKVDILKWAFLNSGYALQDFAEQFATTVKYLEDESTCKQN